jgi:2'-5' RNA ligase
VATLSERSWHREAVEGRAIFVALPLPEAQRAAIDALIERVKAAVPHGRPGGMAPRPVRWVRIDGLHLTVRFLGPTPPGRLAGVERAVAATAAVSRPVRVRLQGAGGFPRPDAPRTLWLRVVEDEAGLKALAGTLDDELAADEWPREGREFRGHLTIARADGVRSGPETLRQLVAAAADVSIEWLADELVLYESVTGAGPAHYEPLLRLPLGERAAVAESPLHGSEPRA